MRTPGCKRLYNVQKFISENQEYVKTNGINNNITNTKKKYMLC